ncbi:MULTISPECIES: OmpH family outer membrane protein [Pasteurellaceae]|uniref:OmpH family outer membrane protein n=1 Tax=Pasteurella atlantica TaxID=2827233 RepID=A0AAW8CI42_9PAST|nr:OmpH family outer membrane protein [Pasteurella atlantica]MBR0573734.1 OmpH family outer membrane protein [Pasteurella atlantica]MDP8039631.1 OmpH family outer membrane protein [Pasteurella atlantica]MDP8041722.1 OmpH family outer membrane protein [Pasteurella atlantica]MDP8044004.1 OmpH family outer membrane protein [Pasteurella atlantica]MDP8045982.1 OmpH family outer membrane protein [Pasteurella atlantica]
MKKVFKIATLVASLAIVVNTANAKDKIGFVTPQFVIQNHPLFAESSDFSKKVQQERKALEIEEQRLAEEEKSLVVQAKELKEEEDKVVEQIKAKREALSKQAPKLRSKEIKKRQEAIVTLANAFEKKAQAFNKKEIAFREKVVNYRKKSEKVGQTLAMEEAKVRSQIIKQIDGKIKEIAEDKGYTIILNANSVVFASEKENNLDEEVLKAVGGTMPELPAKK